MLVRDCHARLQMQCSALNADLYRKILSSAHIANVVTLQTPSMPSASVHYMLPVEVTSQ